MSNPSLEQVPSIRTRYSAVVSSVLSDKNISKSKILLKEIRLLISGRKVISKQLFYYSRGFQKLALSKGDEVEFNARIKPDKRGLSSEGYRLNYPTKIFRKDYESESLFSKS
ncbi:hypothetical protein CH373_02895 [Leptospira perolatii]|uniref:Uncharacterized protein n=1 Tax=Leptospira perolatii TaxID=2023191 RepID=A0A2M9ZSJ5_9LEPT|nr:hypothetical protein [Leptospira perolatii]PJZ71459.1 hypothetical protein CH360_02890 [Leptospira perolatii]PJZ74994.1 hypothetical protein CH373_02895 [Leptospira perolatii]